jgi:hypothetical protein
MLKKRVFEKVEQHVADYAGHGAGADKWKVQDGRWITTAPTQDHTVQRHYRNWSPHPTKIDESIVTIIG